MILGIGGCLTGILPLMLPETAGVDLPNTIEEAESFGLHQKFFYIPFIHGETNSNQSDEQQRCGSNQNVSSLSLTSTVQTTMS